jgi:aquaporin Z
MSLVNRALAEFLGTFWLVLGGCGSAVLAAAYPEVGIGLLGVSLAFGLTVLTMAYAIGHISGCHLNPAVSLGLTLGGRFAAKDLGGYVAAQVLGGIVAAGVLYLIASGQEGFDLAAGFAANGYGEHSPGRYSLLAGFVAETVMTFMFLFIILGATDRRAPQGFAPLAIGLGLTLIHLVSIPVTNTSVNPARSTAVAVFVGDWALAQLWLFWVAPLIGAALAGVSYRRLSRESEYVEPVVAPPVAVAPTWEAAPQAGPVEFVEAAPEPRPVEAIEEIREPGTAEEPQPAEAEGGQPGADSLLDIQPVEGSPLVINKMLVGEALHGDGNEIAHIDLIMGPRGSAAQEAFANSLTNNKNGFTSLLAVVAPNLPCKPNVVMFNKVTIKNGKQATQMFGPAQRGVALAVTDCVEDGTIPADEADDLFICVGVFIHWLAQDDAKIQDYNYEATKLAIQRAVAGAPKTAAVLAHKGHTAHPFAAHL